MPLEERALNRRLVSLSGIIANKQNTGSTPPFVDPPAYI